MGETFSSDRRLYVDWGKLLALVITTGALAGLGLAEVLEPTTVALGIGSVIGYVTGNGRLAARGGMTQPMIGYAPAVAAAKTAVELVRVTEADAEHDDRHRDDPHNRRRDDEPPEQLPYTYP